jgi:excisionase family DNA binding protein
VISTDGLLTVHEAAKRLNRSTEQVRRYLREGKLKGQRIGNQWFVEESTLSACTAGPGPLIAIEIQERARVLRRSISRRNKGGHFDVVADLRRLRDGD